MVRNTPEDIWDKIEKGVFVIVEAGKNFIQTEEDRPVKEYLANAKQLVDEAVESGADAIKFQTHTVEDEIAKIDFTSPHFTGKGSNRYDWITRNTDATPLNEFWKPLKQYCDSKEIIFMSTPMSRGAAEKLDQVGVNIWKIGSGDILDFVCMDYLRNSDKPIILSSGMSTLEEVKKAVNFLHEKNSRVALLHCVSKYPCPPEELHLGTINFFKDTFDMPIGFSDHSIGIEPDLVAVAMGATIVEKHFSLSRDFYGADHKVSMTPDELTSLTAGIKEVQENPAKKKEILESDYAKQAMSGKEKIVQEDEAAFRPLFRKSLVAGQDIQKGAVFTKEMIYAMRPQGYLKGLPSEEYEQVIKRIATRDFKKYEPISYE